MRSGSAIVSGDSCGFAGCVLCASSAPVAAATSPPLYSPSNVMKIARNV